MMVSAVTECTFSCAAVPVNAKEKTTRSAINNRKRRLGRFFELNKFFAPATLNYLSSWLERGRSIHPQQACFRSAGIFPTMWNCALEVKTVSRLEPVFLAVQSNCKLSAQDVEKLFALVRVRLAALRRRRDTKQMRLHYRVAPCQQLHTHSGPSLQNLSGMGTHVQAV